MKNNKRIIYWLLGILIITLVVYLPALNNGFLNWDDDWYVIKNPLIQSLNIKNIFFQYYEGQYSPLVMLSMAVNHSINGFNPWAFHFVNIAIHLINTTLVFWFIYLLFYQTQKKKRIEIAGFIAIIFGVHTLYMESVVWVSAQKVVMFTLFFLASLINYIRYIQENKKKYYYYSLVLFILSFLSKEQAVSLSITLIAIDFLLNRNLLNKKVILEKIPFFVLAIIFCIISVYAPTSNHSLNENYAFVFYKQIFFASYGFVQYLLKLVIPFNLSVIHLYPENFKQGIPPVEYWIYFIIVLTIIIFFVYLLKRSRPIAFAIVFFIINIILLIQLIPLREFVMADRYAYLPSIGFFFLIGFAYKNILEKKHQFINMARVVLTVYIIFLAIYTHNQCTIWKDSMTVWNNVLSKYPHSFTALNNRGNIRQESGDLQGAVTDFDNAIACNPKSFEAYNNRGNAKQDLGNIPGAIADFNKAIQLKPDNYEAYSNRGIAKAKTGNMQSAVLDFNKAIEIKPTFIKAYINRGNAKTNIGDFEGAIADFDKAISMDPNLAETYYNRGLAKYYAKDVAGAINDFTKTIQLKSDYANAYYSRGLIVIQQGQKDVGCADLQKASRLGHPTAYTQMQNYCN